MSTHRAPRSAASANNVLLQLWKHELLREFSDKLLSDAERAQLFEAFRSAVTDCIEFPKPSAPATSSAAAAAPIPEQNKAGARLSGRESRRASPAATPRLQTPGASPRAKQLKNAPVCAATFCQVSLQRYPVMTCFLMRCMVLLAAMLADQRGIVSLFDMLNFSDFPCLNAPHVYALFVWGAETA